jgi:hypothetical protein
VIAPRARGAAGARPGAPPAGGAPTGAGGRFGGAASLVTRPGSRGVPVVVVSTDGRSVFQQGATPDSGDVMPKAYVERIDIRTGARTRVYESAGDVFETISAPLDDDFTRMLVQRESPTVVPQSFVVTTASKQAAQLTRNVDPMPEMSATIKRSYTARRADGKTFRVRVTLPAGYREGTRLPALFWFYPREFDNQRRTTARSTRRRMARRIRPAASRATVRAPWRSSPRRDMRSSSQTPRSSRAKGGCRTTTTSPTCATTSLPPSTRSTPSASSTVTASASAATATARSAP